MHPPKANAGELQSPIPSEAQFAHRLLSGLPHWLQKREPAPLSVPQFEQRIVLPGNRVDITSYITHRGKNPLRERPVLSV